MDERGGVGIVGGVAHLRRAECWRGPVAGAGAFGFAKAALQYDGHGGAHAGVVAKAVLAKDFVQVQHVGRLYAQALGQGAQIVVQAEADFGDVGRGQYLAGQRQGLGVAQLQHPGRAGCGQLHDVGAVVVLAGAEDGLALGIKTQGAGREQGGAGLGPFCGRGRHLDGAVWQGGPGREQGAVGLAGGGAARHGFL